MSTNGVPPIRLSPYRACTLTHYDPVVTRKDDGSMVCDWPAGAPDTAVISRDLFLDLLAARVALDMMERAMHPRSRGDST